MSEITTAAELDALPYHSTAISIERYVVVQRCADGRWRTPGMTDAFTTTRLIDWGLAPLAVLWRPDRPAQPTAPIAPKDMALQTVQPSVEAVAEVLYDRFTRNRVAEWEDITEESSEPRSAYMDAARAILALIGGRTEAEVRAEALEEAAGASMEWIFFKPDGWGSNPADQSAITAMSWVLDWLHARAAAIRAGEQP